MSRTVASALATLAAVLTVAGVAGCSLGPGPGTGNVTVTVTRGFGHRVLRQISEGSVPGSETVMGMLQRRFRVSTRYGGGFVQSIDGAAGDSSGHDWFYYVNGVEAPQGAATTAVHRGDRIWWDLHDWYQTDSVPAVVGSFPEPFVHGVGGKRLPTVIECAPGNERACTEVSAEMRATGVPVASQLLGTGSGTESLALLVGTWAQLRPTIVSALIAKGPGRSGVYARFSGSAPSTLQLLDPEGRPGRTLGAGAGLVAATRDQVSQPTWVVTGTDATGVAAAAASLTPVRLRNRFALAVQGASYIPVPVNGG